MAQPGLSAKVQTTWDAGAAHLARHPRKYTALGIAGAFIKDWWPWFKGTSEVVGSWLPDVPASMDWLDKGPYAIGFLFVALVWWETRKQRAAVGHAVPAAEVHSPSGSPDQEAGVQDMELAKAQALAHGRQREEQLVALANQVQSLALAGC